MSKIAFLFPGQGSQFAGMGKTLADACPAARAVFDQADRALGFPLSKLCFEGPEEVLTACEAKGIAFLPFFPLAVGALGKPQPALSAAAERHGATPAQIAIAWLLARSPVMLPIPGTGSPEHLEENWGARNIVLTKDEVMAIAAASRS